MSFEDKILQCSECGATFTFSASEQEFFASKGYTNDPKRCPTCRQARKTDRSTGGSHFGYNSSRQMFPAVCAECGKETEVPFQPHDDRPVYCRDCYQKMKPTRRV
ncbi:MAG: zinc-ribbon domain containing protein [Chloroflexota bacterium]